MKIRSTMKKVGLATIALALGILSVQFWIQKWWVEIQRHDSVVSCVEIIQSTHNVSELIKLGERYFGGVDYDLRCAKESYLKAVSIEPTGSILAWHQLGRIHFILGDFESALGYFDKQIEHFGDSLPNVHYMRGLVYGYRARQAGSAGDWERAEAEFLKYLTLDETSPWARVDLSWVYFAQGRYGAMKPTLEKGLMTHPKNPWLLNMYGLALLNTGDKEGARQYFDAASYYAGTLTVQDWGAAYPGNDPNFWSDGLDEFRAVIEQNQKLTAQ